ncbi:Protein toll [Orchesella cincta]|uniref:Protein toll n=1 Tax=Orchesella cincta TaxID=48709 RepID=A0A1D2MUE8_ORCCI|nr:Protein toll [Orchesella cincta]
MVVSTLNLKLNQLVALPPKVFHPCKGIRELDLHNNSLTALSPMLLNGLEHLQVLDLSMNSLASQYIASEIFNSCVRLVILNLRSNQFTHISNTTFTNLYSLQILDISENLISSIDENTFAPMSNLHSLHLGRNRLVSIDSNMLNGLFVLSKLSLDYNQISVIRPDAMKNCTSLADLSLIGNRIGESNGEVPHALRSLANLRSIDLGENSISQFHSESFYGNSNLIGLRLVENRISELGSDLCQYNKNLRVLNLAKNRIPSGKISSRAFHSCGNLRVLRLDENLLDEINFADTLPSLLWLNVSQNALKVLDYGLLPKKLEWLDIRYNELESLVGSHGGIRAMDASYNRLTNLSHHSIPTSIEILRVNNNRLNRISRDTFLGLSSLRRVEMISNQLENIPLNALRISPNGNPTKPLPEFFFGGNALLCDCHMEYLAPSRLKQLNFKTVCPSNCTCYRDSEWLFNVVNCANSGHTSIPPLPMDTTEVYIDSNNIKVLKSHSFIGRKNTKKLFLNSSGIEQISNKSFNGLQSLEILHLEFNRIKILHGYEFDQLSRLRELYLQSNLISAISNQTFLGLKSLEVLRIDGNRLAVFQVWQLSLNPYLVEAYISNPFSCECDYLHQIYLWVTDNSRKVVDLRHLQCFWNTTHKPGPHLIDYNQTCSSWAIMQMKNGFDFTSPLPLALAFVSFITLFILVVALVILCRENFSLWLFTKFNGLRMCSAGADFEDDKSYDSYLIYSQKDEEFVAQRVADMLETNDNYRLCLHYRDLICETGDLKDMMIGALENSKSVLIILSRNFLQGEWSSGEYRSAFHAVLKKSQRGGGGMNMGGGGGKTPPKKILIVFIEDIPKVEISPDIRSWVRHNKIQVIKWNIHSPDYNKNRKFWNKLKFSLPDPSSHYHSNITSNTTTTSASSGESNGGIMATLKYSTAMQAESQLHHVPHSHIGQHPNHHHHPHHHHQTHPHHHQQIIVDESGRFTTITTSATNTLNSVKYWPYGATNFVALPPKYQQGSHHGSVGGSHPPSMHSPGSPHSLHYHPPLPISNPPKSPPSSQSTDSTTTTMADEAPSLLSQLTMASFNRSNNSPSASSATKSPVPVPKSSYSSRNTLVNNPISNSNSTSNNIVNGGESYLDGEHVYSTLDPPSPQPTQQSMSLSQNILGNGSSGGAPNFLNNIHLPNGYTYQPQSSLNQHQQNHHHFAPLSSPSGAAAPGNKHGHGGHHHQVMSSFVGNGAANNGGVGTGGKQQGFKQKVSDGNNPVQTYLV